MKLSDYIKGLRKGKDAHLIEKDSMQDPFLYEAIEGFDSVQDDHMIRIAQIKKQIKSKKNTATSRTLIRGIAASLIFVLALGGYFLIDGHKSELRAQQHAGSNLIDIYVPHVFYEENIAIIAQQNTMLVKNFRPEISRFSVDEVLAAASISEYEMDILVNDRSAKNEIPIDIYMPNAEKYKKTMDGIQQTYNQRVDDDSETKTEYTASETILSEDGSQNNFVDRGVEIVERPVADASDSENEILAQNQKEMDEIVISAYSGTKKVASQNKDFDNESSVFARSSKQTFSSLSPRPVIGYEKYDAYLQSALQHPTDDICRDRKGKVVLEFSVDKEGRPYDILVKYSLCGTSDKEAIRLLESGPRWTTGEQRTTIKVEF